MSKAYLPYLSIAAAFFIWSFLGVIVNLSSLKPSQIQFLSAFTSAWRFDWLSIFLVLLLGSIGTIAPFLLWINSLKRTPAVTAGFLTTKQ